MAGFQQLKVTGEVDFSGAAKIGLPNSLPGTDLHVHKNGNDGNDGLGYADGRALLTIGAALTKAASAGSGAAYRRGGVRIFVGGGYYEEALTTPTNAECPFGQLIGYSPADVSRGCVYVYSGAAASPWLTVLARGWRISGFEIQNGTSAAGILLDSTTGNAAYTQVDHCHLTAGLKGIEASGAPNYVHILDNEFTLISETSAVALGATVGANCNVWTIANNTFLANVNHIVFDASTAPYSATIKGNVFHDTWVPGGSVTSAIELTTSAASNVIFGNFLGGTFSIAGGYRGGTTDEWYGNYCSAGLDSVADPA